MMVRQGVDMVKPGMPARGGATIRPASPPSKAWLRAATALAVPLFLAGCGSSITDTPVEWWHQLEGGRIARQRPPPPGIGDPYPSLGSVPARPTVMDPGAQQQIENALSADRTRAQGDAELAPIPAVPAAPASPPPKPAAADADAASARLDAATAPAAPASAAPAPAAPQSPTPAAPSAPPVKAAPPFKNAPPAKNATPLEAASTPSAPATSPAPAAVIAAPASRIAPAVSGSDAFLPALPTAPPPAPSLPGMPVPTLPAPASPVGQGAPPAASPLPAASATTVPIDFAPGSTILPPAATAPLRALAAARHGRPVAAHGRGEAASSDPDVQAAAMRLGVQRARAIGAALVTMGVPAAAIRLDAQAAGRGGFARLVE